jgi:hypothetical protein
LGSYVPALRSDRPAQADFASSFEHRNHHDVGDPNPSD